LAKVKEAKTADSLGDVAMDIDGEDEVEEEDEPFDYSKAESVLHGKRSSGEGKQKKPFNPYTKSSDAPSGLRRLQTERPGKSQTFKS
jgi:exosome complex exonuclease RRP6